MTKLDWRIVDRYLAGEATPAEDATVEGWLARSPAFRMLIAELHRGMLDEETIRRTAAEVRASLEFDIALPLTGQREAPQPDVTSLASVRPLPARRRFMVKAAAAIALLLGGSLAIWARGKMTMQTVTAPPGKLVPVSLPDSSQVILGPGSTLRYAKAFGVRNREIDLDGEAYFAVIHDAGRPFVVHAGNLTATDLGTEFVVRAYREDRAGRVVVRKGRVGIAGTVVGPGLLGRLDANGAPVVEPADMLGWFSWTEGELFFNGMPLGDALPRLSRWYDVDFRMADSSIGRAKLAGHFATKFSDDVIQDFDLAFGLKLKRAGRVVTIERAR